MRLIPFDVFLIFGYCVFIDNRADAPVMGHLWEHFLCGDLVVG